MLFEDEFKVFKELLKMMIVDDPVKRITAPELFERVYNY